MGAAAPTSLVAMRPEIMRDVWEGVVSAFISLLDAGQDSVIVIRAPFGKQVCCVSYLWCKGTALHLSSSLHMIH